MELTLWTYEGPPHVGAMRIASSMKDIHYVLHAPHQSCSVIIMSTHSLFPSLRQRLSLIFTTTSPIQSYRLSKSNLDFYEQGGLANFQTSCLWVSDASLFS